MEQPRVPASGAVLTADHVHTVGAMAYVWGWPRVNSFNRRALITQAPEPGRLGGILPAAPRGQIGMLNDYMDASQTFVVCPNQDVAYGLGYFSLDDEPAVIQVPDFGERFWAYALYDARTDQFGQLGKQYGTEPGFYLLVGPNWDAEVPKGVTALMRSSTEYAMAGPRVAPEDSDEDRAAIKSIVNQILAYPLAEFDGQMKTKDWDDVPSFPAPDAGGGEERLSAVVVSKSSATATSTSPVLSVGYQRQDVYIRSMNERPCDRVEALPVGEIRVDQQYIGLELVERFVQRLRASDQLCGERPVGLGAEVVESERRRASTRTRTDSLGGSLTASPGPYSLEHQCSPPNPAAHHSEFRRSLVAGSRKFCRGGVTSPDVNVGTLIDGKGSGQTGQFFAIDAGWASVVTGPSDPTSASLADVRCPCEDP